MPGTEVAMASAIVGAYAEKEVEGCRRSFPCYIDVEGSDEYGFLKDTCNATGGAFQVFTYNLTCSGNSVVYSNYPACADCTADATKAEIESLVDVHNCIDTISHTGTTDFSGSGPADPPASAPSESSPPCLVMSSAVQTARTNLDDQVAEDIFDCPKLTCEIDVSRKHGYTELMDSCETAQGIFHIIKLNIVCPNLKIEFNNYPECWVSGDEDSACTPAFLEESFETAWDIDGCDEIATHTGTTNFSGSGSSG
jgi:hypothetical protein